MLTRSSAANRSSTRTRWFRSRLQPILLSKLVLAALAASLLASPAWATQGLSCRATEGAAAIGLSLGSAGGLGFAGASLSVGERSWVTDPAYGTGEIF